MSDTKEEKLKNIQDEIISLLSSNSVTPEESVFLLSDIIFYTYKISSLLSKDAGKTIQQAIKELVSDVLSVSDDKMVQQKFIIRHSNEPLTVIGLDRGWGLDPSLLKENN